MIPKSLRKVQIPLLVVAVLALQSTSLFATKMLQRNAEELADLADRIFVGVCISAEEKQMDFPSVGSTGTYTEYTFQVEESIKGVTGGTVVLRQLGRARGIGSIVGMPAYDVGKTYLMFLRADSEYGLASPIGLGQGAFEVTTKDSGSQQAINAFGNLGLFHRMDSQSAKYSTLEAKEKSLMRTKKGPVDFKNFKGLLKKMAK